MKKIFHALHGTSQDCMAELRLNMESVFWDAGISFEELEPEMLSAYRKAWVKKFLPEKMDSRKRRKMEALCLGDGNFCGYLWHLFSYEVVEHLSNEEARMAYDKLEKNAAVLILNTEDIAYRVTNFSRLSAESLDEFEDVTITADDFAWTYAKTHEGDCGPYFCER